MRLSAFTVADAYDEGPASDDRLLEVVRLARAAEAAGLSTLWVAEHHFHRGGSCPAPPVLLAACGAVTHRLRLGSMVSVLPFHRPIDVVESYATLDRLVGGRLSFGVGSGYLPMELEGFGIDPATKRERFDASLDEVLAAFGGVALRPGGPQAPAVTVNVRPVQRPHPPVWVAVQRREAIAHVARRGFSVALVPYATVSGTEELADQVREFRAELPKGVRAEVAAAVHLYAGDRPEVARRAFARYLAARLDTHSTFYRQKAARDPAASTPEGIERAGLALFGPAAEVAERLERFAAAGVDELLGIFDFGGMPPEEVERSVAALGAAWAARRGAATS